MPILDLVARERGSTLPDMGSTLLDSTSADTNDSDSTSDTDPETTTSEDSVSATTLLNFNPKVNTGCYDMYRDTVNVVFTHMSET